MVQNLIIFIDNIFKGLPELVVVIVASLPVSELRGAIPLAIFKYDFPPLKAYILSLFGNILPVIPVLFFLNYAVKFLMKKIPLLNRFFNWWFDRTRRKSQIVEKYESLGLMLFVSIPLPITGAWTGCVAAYLFKIRFRYALISIICGIILAGIIVTLASVGILKIF